jgi:hypothetical protein
MKYAIVIWLIAAFALWDSYQNRGQYTKPVAHFIYRVAGGY